MVKNGFERYELADRVKDTLFGLGFWEPTPVQEKVIPLFFQGKNVIVEAPTGTGKTAAYGLPLISRLNLLKRSTQAMIILPTRDLALQVARALRSFFDGETLKVGVVIGGVPVEESFQEIKREPHILVVVPGRLRDVLSQHDYPYIWRDIKHLIVDEGDKLLESGFMREFEEIRSNIRNSVQLGFFSATISDDAEKMMRERMDMPHVIRLKPFDVLKNITFFTVAVQEGKREATLATMIEQQNIRKALIFSSRREDLYYLTGYLRNLGIEAEAYYGSQEQTERDNILRRFREGHIRFLVATDLAARGLDIMDLPAVINMAIPSEYDYYLHRIGRTGRAGAKGKVFNLVASEVEGIELERHHREIGLNPKLLDITPNVKKPSAEDRRVKVHISRGKEDKIRATDIVGFLTNDAFLTPEQIGTITIYDSYTIVDIPLTAFDTLILDEELRLKGKSIKIRKFSIDEAENRAKAVKSLLRDRKRTAAQRERKEESPTPKKERLDRARDKKEEDDKPKAKVPSKSHTPKDKTAKPSGKSSAKPPYASKGGATKAGAKPKRSFGAKPTTGRKK